jgi:CRISPR-associated protein Cmr1
MTELLVKLETITPLLMGGANARGTPELRPPSIRGALRYWFRAAAGGSVGEEKFGLIENCVFGNASEKSPRSSPITIRKTAERFSLKKFSEIVEPQQNNQTRQSRKPGIAYLFFAARKTQDEPERSALEGNFSLTLSTPLLAD